MPRIPARGLREKTSQELLEQIRQLRKKLFDATVRGASGEAIKPHEKRQGRRLIARIRTVLRERTQRRELAEELRRMEPQAKGASARAARLAAGEARPQLGRLRVRDFFHKRAAAGPADRAAVQVAEVKRLLACVQREDAGEKK